MKAIHTEATFENELCSALREGGWHHSKSDAGYDRELALYTPDVLDWIKSTQPKEWAKVTKRLGANAESHILKLMRKELDRVGTITVLRNGFKDVDANIKMCQFRPAHTINVETQKLYNTVKLRVMQQVHYSVSSELCIDLVLFCNGIPVATLELKTELTQSYRDALRQYQRDRLPRDPVSRRLEPLLRLVSGALVHFAVSTDQVFMTTELDGDATNFLPFNLGNNMGAGNPPNPTDYRTAYLWRQVLQRDAWLNLLHRFIFVTGTAEHKEVVFPRMHQWQAVTALVETAIAEGAGNRYLIQHSAGSGKSNSIGWLSHQLANAHNSKNDKTFDAVIVITDRTVLDSQLRDTIMQIDHKPGLVVAIKSEEGSKSGQLADALTHGAAIIIVTLQTFPHVLNRLKSDQKLHKLKFAVIADEAHSSQSGTAAKKLKHVLSAERQREIADGADLELEELLQAEADSHALALNVSWFAFTATPKQKTLEMFGRIGSDGLPHAFHVYSMQQAIEEGFILDVLKNYTSYRVAYQLAHQGEEKDVEERRAKRAIVRWVQLHEHNISQKVAVIVEHFRRNVQGCLDGHAKAMVVTGSRLEAVRYKRLLDRYIAEQKYTDLDALVAFSGEVDDEGTQYSETSTVLNPRLRQRDIREAFGTNEFQILIVANKFQTGFDQPMLCAMYVDKRLDGVAAVQTLSRLNRVARGKTETWVLDFVNDPADILAAFQVYYRRAEIAEVTDPNLVHQLHDKLNHSGIYLPSEVDALVKHVLNTRKATQATLQALLAPAVSRWRDGLREAQRTKNVQRVEELRLFRTDVVSLLKLYSFLSQIINYGDTDLEKHTIYLRFLLPLLQEDVEPLPVDLTALQMTHYRLRKIGSDPLQLTPDPHLSLIHI